MPQVQECFDSLLGVQEQQGVHGAPPTKMNSESLGRPPSPPKPPGCQWPAGPEGSAHGSECPHLVAAAAEAAPAVNTGLPGGLQGTL